MVYKIRETPTKQFSVVEYPNPNDESRNRVLITHDHKFVCERLIDILINELPEHLKKAS